MIRGIRRLPPGHALRFRDGRATVTPYWSLPVPAPDAVRGSYGDAVADTRRLLEEAVASRLEAEVPVGVFLSGGIDSSAIAAFAARRGPVRSFTLRPDDAGFDEGEAARELATAIGTEHVEVRADAATIAAGFETIFARIDEPIGDSSLVPTWLLSRGAREHVKVALGGEGADELFGGYPTYSGARLARVARVIPGPVRRLLATLAGGGGLANVGTRFLVRRLLDGAGLPNLERHLAWFGAFPLAEQLRLFRPEARPAIVGEGLLGPIREAAGPALGTGDDVDALLRVDILLHLPDALLAKVDRASMLASLEVRAPFLERALVERAAGMPAAWKVRGLKTKLVLREALAGIVPESVLKRRKRGFAVPVAKALVGALGDRLRDRLGTSSLARDFFDVGYFSQMLDAHRAGAADHSRRLYTLLALLEWAEMAKRG
jgi:asparagine synthase (glutamine-hydrolysing)